MQIYSNIPVSLVVEDVNILPQSIAGNRNFNDIPKTLGPAAIMAC